MKYEILKVTKGRFYVYFNNNLRSYGQLYVLVFSTVFGRYQYEFKFTKDFEIFKS